MNTRKTPKVSEKNALMKNDPSPGFVNPRMPRKRARSTIGVMSQKPVVRFDRSLFFEGGFFSVFSSDFSVWPGLSGGISFLSSFSEGSGGGSDGGSGGDSFDGFAGVGPSEFEGSSSSMCAAGSERRSSSGSCVGAGSPLEISGSGVLGGGVVSCTGNGVESGNRVGSGGSTSDEVGISLAA